MKVKMRRPVGAVTIVDDDTYPVWKCDNCGIEMIEYVKQINFCYGCGGEIVWNC